MCNEAAAAARGYQRAAACCTVGGCSLHVRGAVASISTAGVMGSRDLKAGVSHCVTYFYHLFSSYANVSAEVGSGQV